MVLIDFLLWLLIKKLVVNIMQEWLIIIKTVFKLIENLEERLYQQEVKLVIYFKKI